MRGCGFFVINSDISGSRSSASSGKSKKIFRRKRPNSVQPAGSGRSGSSGSSSRGSSGTDSAGSHGRFRRVGQENREPVFVLDVRTQNSRLVTSRQRQEIYSLNRVMTRLENDKFKQFCQEKGHRGDDIVGETYDIFL